MGARIVAPVLPTIPVFGVLPINRAMSRETMMANNVLIQNRRSLQILSPDQAIYINAVSAVLHVNNAPHWSMYCVIGVFPPNNASMPRRKRNAITERMEIMENILCSKMECVAMRNLKPFGIKLNIIIWKFPFCFDVFWIRCWLYVLS